MADPGRSETLTDERDTDAVTETDTEPDTETDTDSGSTSTDATDTTSEAEATDSETTDSETTGADTASTDGLLDDEDGDDLDEDDEPEPRPWALVVTTAVAAVAVVALAVTAFIAPGWVVTPGSPDARAAQMTSALAAKDPAALEAVSCRDQQGNPTNPFPPDALGLIQAAEPAGPTQLVLDTQARAPVDLTLSAQGQVQRLPADLVLGVTDGQWCMSGISQRQ
ncbi:hypothetical protein [Actinomycetospora aeridis]|uniref:Uncharacterized protein n=1 Tax=Actinomycetospora aeridis TaxID=3129231 RepID=A0ABU8NB99_9PSEU